MENNFNHPYFKKEIEIIDSEEVRKRAIERGERIAKKKDYKQSIEIQEQKIEEEDVPE